MRSGRCICIGCGESLRGFDFSKLDNIYTIGCNHIMLDYPKLDLGVFLDTKIWTDHSYELLDAKCSIAANIHAIPDDVKALHIDRFHPVDFTEDFKVKRSEDGNLILLGMLTGLTAIHLAILKKFSEIYLLGYDMYEGHYHDRYPAPDIYASDYLTRKSLVRFDVMANAQERYKFKVYNCNPASKIKSFEFKNIEEIL